MPSSALQAYEVTVRRFDPSTGPDGKEAQEFVLPVDSPDPEHAVSAAMSNAVAFTQKVDQAAGLSRQSGRSRPVAFMATGVRPRLGQAPGAARSSGAPQETADAVRFAPGRTAMRILLGSALVFAGVSHWTFARKPFQAQVPPWVPLDPDAVVLASGVVEVALGAAIAVAPERHRQLIGDVAAVFFTAIFPGNIAQLTEHRDDLGLDSDRERAIRLIGQPVLVGWALWATRTGVRR